MLDKFILFLLHKFQLGITINFNYKHLQRNFVWFGIKFIQKWNVIFGTLKYERKLLSFTGSTLPTIIR